MGLDMQTITENLLDMDKEQMRELLYSYYMWCRTGVTEEGSALRVFTQNYYGEADQIKFLAVGASLGELYAIEVLNSNDQI